MKKILLIVLILCGCTERKLTNERYDSLINVIQHQQERMDSLLSITNEIESFRELKEAKVLISKWAWAEAELKLIDILKRYPGTNVAKESKDLLVLVVNELINIKVTPIRIEDVIEEDKARIAKIRKELLGKKYELPWGSQLIEKYGFPETQPGTNGKIWIAFFPYGQFTAFIEKREYEIIEIKGKEWWKEID